jgi:beta-lactamase superfamily II metal-dependent hydrolase
MVKNKFPRLVILFCACLGLLIYLSQAATSQTYSIQVSFIDVGEGDAALIQNSDGYNILIDGGKASAGSTVVAYLRNNGVFSLDAMVASHPDSDHIGGLITVLEATDITVDTVIYNGYPGDTQTWIDFVTAVENEGLTLTMAQFPGEIHWGTTTVYILNPTSGLINPEPNAASLVLLLDHNEVETLFTGDIDGTVETEIIARGTPIAADLLKVPHHGSNTSTSIELLNAVKPQDSMISVGPNPYGHPGAETLARLLESGTNIWRTDINGTIIVTSSDGSSYQVIPLIGLEKFFLPMMVKK